MVSFKHSIFKNKADRKSFMQNFLNSLIESNLLDEACQNTIMANGNSGCYLSHGHGRLPELMYIGVYTDEDGDYAFLRFWEYEDDKNLAEIISRRENFLKLNERRIKEHLGRDIGYHSKNERPIGTFKIDGDDHHFKGFVAHGKIRDKKNQLQNDLLKLSKVLELIMNAEKDENSNSGNVKSLKQIEDEFDKEVAEIIKRTSQPDFKSYGKIIKKVSSPRLIYYFDRDPQVVAYALLLAKGVCQGCGADKNSLFERASNGSVYLEVHHIDFLSDGGRDTLDNAVALCPTCHRLMHYGKKSDIEKIRRNIDKKMKEREELIKQILEKQ